MLPWLDAGPRAAVDAQLLRARTLLALGDFVTARALLEPLIAGAPSALLPRVVLSHVLLREDRDRPAAQRALRDVLTLCPDHAEARNNLAILCRPMGEA